jgi:hypothetical protein
VGSRVRRHVARGANGARRSTRAFARRSSGWRSHCERPCEPDATHDSNERDPVRPHDLVRQRRGARHGRREVYRPRRLFSHLDLFPARTRTLPPATHTNSYALGSRELLLVEPATPYEDEQRAWIDWARALAAKGVIVRIVWEAAFVATSLALGESEDATIRALADPAPAKELLTALGSPDKRARAKALAKAITAIAFDLERAEVTWAP